MSTDKTRFENSIRYDVTLEDGRAETYWNAASAADSVSTSTSHITGKTSISFDKVAGNTQALIYRNPASTSELDLDMFSRTGYIYVWLYLSSITNVSSVEYHMGTDASNYFKWIEADTSLQAGWNQLVFKCTDFTQVGEGINWYGIEYMAINVIFDSSANTLSGILLDSVTVHNPVHSFGVGGEISIGSADPDDPTCIKLADVTNGIDNTYTYPFDMREYKYFGIQFILNGGSGTITLSVEISAMCDVDDTTAQYEPLRFGCMEEFTLSNYVIADEPVPARYGRVKVVVDTGGNNDASWKIYLVKIS